MESFYIPIASVTNNGVVSIVAQTFAGDKTFNADVYGLNFYNRTSLNNAAIALAATGVTIAHNVADANTALIVTNTNASSTGAIVEFKWNGTTKFQVAATGSTVVNKDTNDGVHALKIGQNHASATGNILTLTSVGVDVTSFDKNGGINLFKGVSTVLGGMPIQVATIDLTAQNTTISNTNAYAVPVGGAGMYEIKYVAYLTTAATTSSVLQFGYRFTNENSVVVSGPSANVTGVNGNIVNTTAGGIISGSYIVYCAASTNIQYNTTYSSVGATPMLYTLHIRIIKLG